MTTSSSRLFQLLLIPSIVAASAISLSTPCVWAQDAATPTQETAADAASHADNSSEPLLNGSVKKSDASAQTADSNTPDAPNQQDHMYHLAADKLASREKMTANDFRDLQMGATGFAISRNFNEKYATVTEVFPGCAAAAAGVHLGDLIVEGDPTQNYQPNDVTKPIWSFTGGRAGSVVNIKVLRDGQIIPFSITRMNIEDIPDPKVRKTYENMAKKFGASNTAVVRVKKPDESVMDSGH
jgi:C-terminal processing protease CtpA/Prc